MYGSNLTNVSEVIFSSFDSRLAKRLNSAAQLSVGLEDQTLVFLHARNDEFDLWISILNAIGLDVRIGVDELDPDSNIMFLVQAIEWRRSRVKMACIRERFPSSSLCIITGISRSDPGHIHGNSPYFDDARSALQAAGIGFFSIERERYVAV